MPVLALLLYKKYITTEQFVILRDMLLGEAVDDSWEEETPPFKLTNFTDLVIKRLFRFRREDLTQLQAAVRIPDQVVTRDFDVVDGLEALCIVLRRLVYPNRWIELRKLFGRKHSSLSRIFYHVVRHINRNFAHLLVSLDQNWLTEDDFALFAASITQKGGVVQNCLDFLTAPLEEFPDHQDSKEQCSAGIRGNIA